MHSLTTKLVVALAVVLALAGCGGGKKAAKKSAAAPTTTAKPKVPPVAPLTGVPDPTGASLKRCAVTVKIDNTKPGHPKYGVDQADVVYEEVVEGGYTPRGHLQFSGTRSRRSRPLGA